MREEISDKSERPLSDLVRDVLQDIGSLVRGEIRLARAELSEEAKRGAGALGVLGFSAVTGLLAAGCLVTAAIAALAVAMSVGLAALLVGVALLMAAAIAYVHGRGRLRRLHPPTQTMHTLEEDVVWAKRRIKS